MTAEQIADAIGARLVGDGAIEVREARSVESAGASSLVFVGDAKFLATALESDAAAVVCGGFAEAANTKKALLIAAQPKLAFVRAIGLLQRPDQGVGQVHATAVIDPAAKLGEHVSVGAYAVIDRDAAIGSHTSICAHSFIGAGVRIGANSIIKSNVTIYPGTEIGDCAIVHAGVVLGSDGFGHVRDELTGKYEKFPQVGKLKIGDDFEIGANSTVDRGALDETVIGNGVKLDNLVHVAHNVRIGNNVVIAAQSGISGSAVIQDNVIIAGQVGIADHVTIEEGAILGAQCGVPSNKTIRGKGVLFWGTPARPIRQYLKELATLARLAKK